MNEELEHFGRTPVTTPYPSQELTSDSSSEDESQEIVVSGVVDGRIRDYVSHHGEEEEDESEDSDDEEDTDIPEDIPETVDSELSSIRNFCREGCKCKSECAKKLDANKVFDHILNVRDMDKMTKELYIMGTLNDNRDKNVTKRGRKRQRMRFSFKFMGEVVCRKTFLLCFDIGRSAFKGLILHMTRNGAVPRTHGNVGKHPKHALNFDDVKRVVEFLINYSEQDGMPMPAAPRGRDNIPPTYLPASDSKLRVFTQYENHCSLVEPPVRSVKLTSFKNIWSSCVPHIRIASPRDDVCAKCETIRKRVVDAREEEDKLEASEAYSDHVRQAQKERELYNECVRRSRETRDADESERYHHFTFDYSQSVSLPHYYRQMGPLYFLSLRKINIFGFRLDGKPEQLNFIIDENETMGTDGSESQGPNAVISMVDWAIENHGGRPTSFSIHADNCPGQNKNRFVIGYFMWRVMTEQQHSIEYLMQVPGHAKCLVDSGFGNLKTLYRRTDCESMDQLVDVVNKSSNTNTAVRYPQWVWRDWKTFLGEQFKCLKGIRKSQYFRFSASEPGMVTVRATRDDEETRICILKDPSFRFHTSARPEIVPAAGLSEARQSYLFKSVRPYVRPTCQDQLCPRL